MTRRQIEWTLIAAAMALGMWLMWRGTQGVVERPGSKLDGPTSTTLDEFDGDVDTAQ